MIFSPYPITLEDYSNLNKTCPLNYYRVVSADQVPIALPESLRNKCIGAIIIGSGNQTFSTYVINLLRVDEKDSAVDQHPFICAMNSDNEIDLTAGIVHHGNWLGRSSYPGTSFFQAITGSGITAFYPVIGVPPKDFGSLDELAPDSHKDAFWNSLNLLRGKS